MAELEVVSELRAIVWRVEVELGQQVDEGQDLVILESMKTEIPVVSPATGTVTELRVAEGQSVGERQVLLVLSV